ncbi:hypothetical protein DEO72_LG5g2080 [Vigna unguiculata]|uniref:Uncharacterized protein n=1 Tax=Vigna unguiculata TaxID=3917 RepID=A0A4D6LYP2_VIGUN|nr:hypothetical protein DEO72_LG5g2080 [Vigna unguiculata]
MEDTFDVAFSAVAVWTTQGIHYSEIGGILAAWVLRGRNLSHASSRGTAMADAGSGTVRRGVETQQRQCDGGAIEARRSPREAWKLLKRVVVVPVRAVTVWWGLLDARRRRHRRRRRLQQQRGYGFRRGRDDGGFPACAVVAGHGRGGCEVWRLQSGLVQKR